MGGHLFDRILVVVAGLEANLRPGLESLRRMCRDARITLLAGVEREIMVRRLVRSARNPMNIADDYVICPTNIESLLGGRNAVNVEIATGGQTTEQMTEQTAERMTKQAMEQATTGHGGETRGDDERIRQLEKLVSTDDLTGLKNRRYVREFIRQIIGKAESHGFQVTLLLFDIDNFKHYNDAHGHGVGDNVLRQAAAMMQSCCREHDVVARIGGDEFAVVFWDKPGSDKKPEGTDQTQDQKRRIDAKHPREVYFMADRFRREISKSKLNLLGDEGRGLLTISGGLATFPIHGRNIDELFEQADGAMLNAKRSGKNRIYLVGNPGNKAQTLT